MPRIALAFLTAILFVGMLAVGTEQGSAATKREFPMPAEHSPSTLDLVEQGLKIAALVAGGLFFLWKLCTGWLIINLKLSIKADRVPKSPNVDHLSITVIFEKGTTDSVWLQHVTARVKWAGKQNPSPIGMSDEFRWLRVEGNQVIWDQYETSHGPIALSPGESTSIARLMEVPAEVPVTVEVAAYGRRTFWPRGFQWRASAVSLPIPRAPAPPIDGPVVNKMGNAESIAAPDPART